MKEAAAGVLGHCSLFTVQSSKFKETPKSNSVLPWSGCKVPHSSFKLLTNAAAATMSFVAASTGTAMMRRWVLNTPKVMIHNTSLKSKYTTTIQRFQSNHQALLKVPPSPPSSMMLQHQPTPKSVKVVLSQELQIIQRQRSQVMDTITSIQTNLRALQLETVSSNSPTTVPKGGGFQALNRNARPPKKANKGARPNSRIARRRKRSRFGNPRRRG